MLGIDLLCSITVRGCQALTLYWALGVVLFSCGVSLHTFGSSARREASRCKASATGQKLAGSRLDLLLCRDVLHRNSHSATPRSGRRISRIRILFCCSGGVRRHANANQMRHRTGKLVSGSNLRPEYAGWARHRSASASGFQPLQRCQPPSRKQRRRNSCMHRSWPASISWER